MEFNSFGIQNDIVLDFLSIPLVIQKHIRKLTTNIEEMLLSPVISIMSVFRLPTGGNVSPGYVANFKQDIAGFIREIPLTASQLPCLVKEEALLELDNAKKVWKRKKWNENKDFFRLQERQREEDRKIRALALWTTPMPNSKSAENASKMLADSHSAPTMISCLKMDCCQIYQRWTPTTKTQLSLMKEP
jgi:hypothetical protein